MGRWLIRIREGYPRTLLAFALTFIAVALPSTALYVAGSHAADRDAAQRVRSISQRAEQAATLLAQKLAQRLEALRENEDRRPFYHYQNLYHDPKGAHRGPSIVPSPLAEGPADPLIRSHFQIDPSGRVTLPTVNPDLPDMSCQRQRERHVAMLKALQPAAPICCEDDADPLAAKLAAHSEAGYPARTMTLDEEDWLQNLEASRIYDAIRQGNGTPASLAHGSRSGRKVRIETESFHWKTVPLEHGPALVALRRVRTPGGTYTQGFVICNEAMREWLRGSPMPAQFLPAGQSGGAVFSGLPLAGADWSIHLDPQQEIGAAAIAGRAAWARFRRLFLLLVVAATLAGGLAVAIVWQAERLAQQRSRFAASAAHELRTPLAGLRMYGEMLSEGLGDPARARDYARRVAEEAERLGRVVSNVLGFTRLEQGLFKVSPEEGDLGQAVEECLERLRPALEQKGAELVYEGPGGEAAARFDRDALGQIVQNLVDNAEKYSRSSADRRVEVRVETESGGARLDVRDHGPGIPQELNGRLFRAFSRGANADVPEGLGLGLTLTQNLARLQGGRVAYANAEEGGAILSVHFPG